LSIWAIATIRHSQVPPRAVLLTLAVSFVSLAASALHLGRPIYAYRAVKGWRTSWLSREVLALGMFAVIAASYGATLFFGPAGAAAIGAAAAAMGLTGIYCSARIYLVPARPSWNSRYTVLEFFLTAGLLGPLLVRASGLQLQSTLAFAAVFAASAQLVTQVTRLLWMAGDEAAENKASSALLLHRLRTTFLTRLALLLAGGVVLPLIGGSQWMCVGALVLSLTGELAGRWLFFVGTTPKNIASGFIATEKAA
jgi:DMSO reductase anchor subunit